MTAKEIDSSLAQSNLELFILLRTKPSIQGNETLHGIMNKIQETVATMQSKEPKELQQGNHLSQLGLVCKRNKSQCEQVYECVLL